MQIPVWFDIFDKKWLRHERCFVCILVKKRTCNECQIINKVNYKLVKIVVCRNSANKCMQHLKKKCKTKFGLGALINIWILPCLFTHTVRVVLVCFPD